MKRAGEEERHKGLLTQKKDCHLKTSEDFIVKIGC
jgi:hypothetical protein